MFITSDMIYFLLERQHGTSFKVQKCHNVLTSARMYRGVCEAKDCLYIVDMEKNSFSFHDWSGFSFLLFGPVPDGRLDTGNNDAFSITDIKDGYQVLEEVFDIFQRLLSWDADLHDAAGGSAAFARLFPLGEAMLQRPYLLIDRNLYVPAFTEAYRDVLDTAILDDSDEGLYKLPHSFATTILSEPKIESIFSRNHLFLYPEAAAHHRFMCRNILEEGQFIACLAIPTLPGEDWPDSGFIHLYLHFFDFLQEAYLKHIGDTFTSFQNNALHKLLRSILFSPEEPLPQDFGDILHVYHWENGHDYLAVKLQFFSGTQPGLSTQYICQQLEKEWPNSCTLEADGGIAWIIDLSLSHAQLEKQDFHQALAYIVQEHICKAGVSELFSDISDLESCYRQADYALALGQKADPYLWYYRFENYVTRYVCEKAAEDFSPGQLVHKGLLRLWQYDQANDTEYTKTLRFYYKYGFNITKASEAMFVHRTTFIRRLERIRELSGLEPDGTDELLHILLSFELLNC